MADESNEALAQFDTTAEGFCTTAVRHALCGAGIGLAELVWNRKKGG